MLRCIENAIAAQHITREQGEELQRQLDTLLRQGLAPDKIRVRIADDLVAAAKEKKRRAYLMEVRRKVLTEAVLTHRNARGENDPAEALWLILERYGESARFEDVETRKWVIMRQAHAEIADLLVEFRKGALSGDLRRVRNTEVVARMDNVVRELFGHGTGDDKAAALAEAFARTAEKLRLRANAAGMSIKRLDSWGLAQRHDPEALLAIGQRGWVDYLMRPGVLDRDKMVSPMTGEKLTDDKLREALNDVWKTITSQGFDKLEPSYAAYGKGALAKRADDHHRFIHFAGPDPWLAYMRDFRAGDPFEAMMSHISVMSRDIATLEILGPNPEAMRNYLKQLVLKHADETRPVQRIIADERLRLEQLLEKVVGRDTASDFMQRFKTAFDRLADLELRIKAGGEDEALAAAAKAASDDIEGLERSLKLMEPTRVGAERARLVGEINRVEAELAGIRERKEAGEPAGRPGEPGQDRRRVGPLRRELARLKAELDLFEQGDRPFFVEEPGLYQEVIDGIDRMKVEVRKIRVGGFRSVEDPGSKARGAIVRHDAMWEIMRGTHFAPVHMTWANALQSARNIMTAKLLGSAMITALADLGTQRLARKFVGMNHSMLKLAGGWLEMMATADRKEMIEAGLMLDTAVHNMHQHATYLDGAGLFTNKAGTWGSWKNLWLGGTKSVQWTGFVADRVLALSGLSWHTQVSKWLFGSTMQSELGKRIGRSFDQLEPTWRRTLERHLITARDWDAMRGARLYTPHAATAWLRPQEVEQAAGRAVAEKYLAMIHRETRHAVIEGTVRSRTWFGAGRRGTIAGEIVANMGQFKTFGAVYMLLHLGRISREFSERGTRAGLSMVASYAVTLTLVGALVNELFEMANGRDPVLPRLLKEGKAPSVEYWFRALTKAGGLGLVGDVVTAPGGTAAGGLAGLIAGPVGSQFERLRTRSGGGLNDLIDYLEHESGVIGDQELKKRKEGKTARDVIASIREIVPGSTLWYLRLAGERLVFNQLQKAFDPEAERVFRRHEQLQKRRLGNAYWWHPGDLAPTRPPLPFSAPDPRIKAPRSSRRAAEGEAPVLPAAAQRRVAAFAFEVGSRIAQSDQARFTVVDGDTLEAGGQRWRLVGYDAPEVFTASKSRGERQAGVKAALRLKELVMTGRAELEVTAKPDKWGRGRARLRIDGRDAGDVLVGEGLAKRRPVQ